QKKGAGKPEVRNTSPAAGKTAAPPPSGATAPPAASVATPPQTPPAATPQAPANPAAAQPLPDAERGKLEQARRLLAEQRTARELREAYQLAREVADVHPELKEAQHLDAEGAYRLSRWSDAVTYFRRGDPQALAAQPQADALCGLLCQEDPGVVGENSRGTAFGCRIDSIPSGGN